MRTRDKMRVAVLIAGVLLGLAMVMLVPACERLWAQEAAKPTLSEVEELKLVNTYQAAVLAQVDAQAAQTRLQQRRDAYMALVEHMKSEHKWSSDTTFEINAETGKVLVHLPPAKNDTKTPDQGKKEQ